MAEMTAEERAFVDWQLAQVDPLTNRRIGDIVAEKGLDPYRDEVIGMARNANLQAQNQLAAGGALDTVAPWLNPNWREVQTASEQAELARRQRLDDEWRAAQAAGVDVPVLGPSNDPNLGNVRGVAPYRPGTPAGGGGSAPAGGGGSGGGAAPGGGSTVGSSGLVEAGGGAGNAFMGAQMQGVVYGPDGRMYSSPAAAIAAGVTNYSASRPLFSPQGTGGLISGAVVAPVAPTSVGAGLLSGANQQLFTVPTRVQMPGGF